MPVKRKEKEHTFGSECCFLKLGLPISTCARWGEPELCCLLRNTTRPADDRKEGEGDVQNSETTLKIVINHMPSTCALRQMCLQNEEVRSVRFWSTTCDNSNEGERPNGNANEDKRVIEEVEEALVFAFRFRRFKGFRHRIFHSYILPKYKNVPSSQNGRWLKKVS